MLSQLQARFLEDLSTEGNYPAQISSDAPEERFAVYRQNVRYALKNALSLLYPSIWSLLGEECADNLAFAFVSTKENWPISGCLDEWGAGFPVFLAGIKELAGLPYLQDFANYELAKHHAYRAVAAKPMTAADLQSIPPEALADTVLRFVPACRMLRSEYPLDLIQDLLDNPESPAVALDKGPSFAIITRNDSGVCTYWLSKDQYRFFSALYDGKTLEDAAESVQRLAPYFELPTALAFLLDKQLLCVML